MTLTEYQMLDARLRDDLILLDEAVAERQNRQFDKGKRGRKPSLFDRQV